uniref:Uncharacterized protein n=1 Tax=Nothoprocta perdicaria TaxID=30464 RepID=A0A8C7EA98_NOTPE
MCNIIYIYISVLQAIYKDVNSKAYLLRLSSFFNLYLHNCSSNLFFFQYIMSDASEIFCNCRFLYPKVLYYINI